VMTFVEALMTRRRTVNGARLGQHRRADKDFVTGYWRRSGNLHGSINLAVPRLRFGSYFRD
jgi:hypothetical protein